MRLRKAIVWSVAVLAVMLALLLIVILTFDINAYRDEIQARASDALGRPVVIGGELSLGVSLLPTVVAEDISIANPTWASRPIMARVQRLKVQVPLLSLLIGSFDRLHIELDGADVLLERGAAGENNWSIDLDDSDDAGAAFVITSLELRDSTIAYLSPDNATAQLVIDEAEAELDADGELEVEGEGKYNNTPFTLSFATDYSALFVTSPQRPWSFASRLDIADTKITLQGTMVERFTLEGLTCVASIRGKQLHTLAPLLKVSLPSSDAFALSARMTVEGGDYRLSDIEGSIDNLVPSRRLEITAGQAALSSNEPVKVSLQGTLAKTPFSIDFSGGLLNELLARTQAWPLQLKASLADVVIDAKGTFLSRDQGGKLDMQLAANMEQTSVAAQLSLQMLDPQPRLTGKITASTLDIKRFIAANDKTVKADSGQSWLDETIPLDWLQALDVELVLEVKQVLGGPAPIRDIRLTTRLDKERLIIKPIRVVVEGVTLTGGVELDASQEIPSLSLKANTRRLDISRVRKALGLPQSISGQSTNVNISLTGAGKTARAMIEQARLAVNSGPANLSYRASSQDQASEIKVTGTSITAGRGRSVRMTLNGTVQATPVTLTLTGGTLADLLKQTDPWPRIAIDLRSEIEQTPLQVTGRIGTLNNILVGKHVAIDLVARLADAELKLGGTVVNMKEWRGTGAMYASGPNLSRLRSFIGLPAVPSDPFQVSARIRGTGREIRLDDLTVTFGDSSASGFLAITPGQRTRLSASLNSKLLNLGAFIKPESKTDKQGKRSDANGQYFSDQPLVPDWLQHIDVDMQLSVQHLGLGMYGVDEFMAELTLERGQLEGTIKAAERWSTHLRMRPHADNNWKVTVQHKSSLKFDWLVEEDNQIDLRDHALASVELNLVGIGNSMHSLLASSNGTIKTVIGQGLMRQSGLRLLTSGIFRQLLVTVNPLAKSQRHAYLECAVLYLEVKDGIATSTRGVAMQTDEVNAIGSGAVNLKTEEIELHFRTAQRRGVGISIAGLVNPFIMIGGTLSEPRVQANKRGLMTSGAAAWATSGLTLLYSGFFGRLRANDNPCERVLEQIPNADHGFQ